MTLLRYPGSKKKIAGRILAMLPEGLSMPLWSPGIREYREPFLGCGAMASQVLPKLVPATKVVLADKDASLIALWLSVQNAPAELLEMVRGFTPTTAAFYKFKEQDDDATLDPVRRGFQKLALHQLSFSGNGFMSGGPLGGRDQSSKYNVDCRWNPVLLSATVMRVHDLLARFHRPPEITTDTFEKTIGDAHPDAVLYVDPPYVKAGPLLYKHSFTEHDHRELARVLRATPTKWGLSYDDAPLVRELYGEWCSLESVEVTYTGSLATEARRKNHELLIQREAY